MVNQDSKRESPSFEFTPPSRDELRFYRMQVAIKFLMISYLLVTIALAVFLEQNLILLALLFLFNTALTF